MNISDDVVNEYNSYDKMLHVSCKNVYDTELYLKFNHLTIEVVYDKDFLQSIERITNFTDDYFLLHNRRPTILIVGLDDGCLNEYIDFLRDSYKLYINLLSKDETNFNTRDFICLRYIHDMINDLMDYNYRIFDDFRQFEIHTLVNIINED